MVGLRDSIYGTRCVVDSRLQGFVIKRAKARRDLDLELDYVRPMLEVSPEDAKEVAAKVDNSMTELETHVRTFKVVHDECVKKIKNMWLGMIKKEVPP